MFKPVFCASILVAASVSGVTAQIVSIRTVPVSQAHQFAIYPSRTAGMGGVTIALPDSLLDPFTNPGTGKRLQATQIYGSPGTYSVTSNAGGGRSLPVGLLTRGAGWYGGVWLTLQEVDLTARPGLPPGALADCMNCSSVIGQPVPRPPAGSRGNTYAFALLGRELSDELSVGGSISWSRLNAIDGVDMLYAGSAHIDQFGNTLDARLGLTREWADRTLELVALHNRFGTTHNVFYVDPFWDPGKQQFAQRSRVEHNQDRTRTWGVHMQYDQPISSNGWRGGVTATANRMDHPKIPNYEIMNIPRDPGHSSAFNIGLGLSRSRAGSTFGIDVVYEPIWSHTWADAETATVSRLGETIAAGDMTIENHFRFSNAAARLGIAQEYAFERAGFIGDVQLGLAVHGIHYWLDQRDHVQVSQRDHEESWIEWRPTWGLSFRFPSLEIRYQGSVIRGTGRPGVAGSGFVRADAAVALASNILAAPSGPLTLDEVRVRTHQISVSFPIH